MGRIEQLKKKGIKEFPLSKIFTSLKNRIFYIPIAIEWSLGLNNANKSKQALLRLQNKYEGKRCFIVANGPSLKTTDLSRLKSEYTFGMNRIYLSTPDTGFTPTFLVSTDMETMLDQFHGELAAQPQPKFFNYKSINYFEKDSAITFLKLGYNAKFHKNLVKSCWGGHSVTFVCMQLAYYMGFSEVYLIGKDHSYKGQGYPGQFIKATGKEDNHFIKGYFKKGDGWKIPDYKAEELAYEMAKDAFEKDGRIIKDATINGHLNVFKKIDYNSLFVKRNK